MAQKHRWLFGKMITDSEGPALYPLAVFRPFVHLKVVVPAENSQLSLKTPPMVEARSATVFCFFFVGGVFFCRTAPPGFDSQG